MQFSPYACIKSFFRQAINALQYLDKTSCLKLSQLNSGDLLWLAIKFYLFSDKKSVLKTKQNNHAKAIQN